MKLEDYKSGELVLELLHRTDIEAKFIESNENITLNVEGPAMILIDKNY